jgi:hypothetical protein
MTTTQQNNGDWFPYAYFIRRVINGNNYYYGTRHGSAFKSKKHAETVLKHKFTNAEIVTFELKEVI